MDNLEATAESWERDVFIHDLERTIAFARIRCLPRETVIAEGLQFENETTAMAEMAHATEKASAETRSKVDRLLLGLVRLLPVELASTFADPYLDHRRKTRRKWAYAILRHSSISPRNVPRLADVFRKTGDKMLLPFIVKTPECVRILGADFLLQKLAAKDQEYWRMRVLQSLLAYDREAAITISQQFPWEFTFAAGRTEDKSLLPVVQSLFKADAHSGKFAAIYAWALGKLGARDELGALESFLRQRRASATK